MASVSNLDPGWSVTRRKILITAAAILLLFLVLLLFSVVTASPYPGIQDDAFFYAKIADNICLGNGSTFDGITATNGYHPLWMGMATTIRMLFPGRMVFLAAFAGVSLLLVTGAGLLAVRFWIDGYRLTAYIFAAFLLLRYIRDFGLMAMETSILIPLLTGALILCDRITENSGKRSLLSLGLIVALAGLARLDSALLGIMILFFALKKTNGRKIYPVLLPGFITAAGYLLINRVLFGTWMSVSGSMKVSGPGFNSLFFSQLFQLSDPLGIRSPWGLYLLFLVLSPVVMLLRRMPPSARLSAMFLMVFTTCQMFCSQWRLWYWYAYPAVLFTVFCVPPLLQRLLEKARIPHAADNFLIIPSLLVLLSSVLYWGTTYGTLDSDDFRLRNMETALELNVLLHDSTVVTMGDRAGSFAYFFHGHVIQAEGLCGNAELVEAIRNGELEEYLFSIGTGYLLSWTGPHGIPSYESWDLYIPNPAQSTAFNNRIQVYEKDEIMRWPGDDESVFMWKLHEH